MMMQVGKKATPTAKMRRGSARKWARGPPSMCAVILPFARHAGAPVRSSKTASTEILPLDCRMIGKRHLWGTALRSRHLSIVSGRTPSDSATNPIKFQSIEGAVVITGIFTDKSSGTQGQFYARRKSLKFLPLTMDENENEETAIRRRVKEAMRSFRASRGWSQREMAQFMGVSSDNYESYEKPSRGVPAGIIARFCNYTGTDIAWIMGIKKSRKAG